MNADLSALLAAVKDTPTDDAPRLVLADWLDDHGDHARAEFIRLQCHPDFRWTHAGEAQRERAFALFEMHAHEWGLPSTDRPHARFHRGLLTVETPPEYMLLGTLSPDFVTAWQTGWVESVTLLYSTQTRLTEFLRSPWLAGVASLDLSRSWVEDHHLGILTNLPSASGLRSLDVRRTRVTPAGVALLRASPYLTGLQTIQVDPPRIDPFVAVLDRTHRILTMTDQALSIQNVEALAEHPVRPELVHLTLEAASLNADDITRLFAEPWPNLQTLCLKGNRLDNRSATRIAAAQLPALTTLDLSRNEIANPGLRALAESTTMPALTTLDVAHNRFSQAGVESLCRSPHRRGLRTLDLRGNKIGPGSVRLVADATFAGKLRQVVFGHGVRFKADVEALAQLGERAEFFGWT